jgi:SAM-dependent methyltransferase
MIVQNYSVFHSQQDAFMRDWHKPYANLFQSSNKVLDIGCGNGVFLELLKERSIDCIGIDIDDHLVHQLIQKNLPVFHAGHSDAKKYIQGCDAVHISHVIEHLWGDEMKTLLDECASALPFGALMVIRTPNWSNKHVSSGGFWDDYTHKRPYTLRQLEKMLVDMGLQITASGYEPFGWEDLYIVARKPPLNVDLSSDTPLFIRTDLKTHNLSLKERFRQKLRNWLLA